MTPRWAAATVLALAGGAGAAQATGADATHELGRLVYNARCYFCHGYSGDARTLAATDLSPPPRDFTNAGTLDRPAVLKAVRDGRPGSAMKPFRSLLSEAEMQAVAGFVLREFVRDKAPNTAYHTPANGWPEHRRYAAAFPFATGERRLDEPVESLDPALQRGRSLYLASCISCHDRARVQDEGPAWSARPLSYPRAGFAPGDASPARVDAVSSASVYARHDIAPKVTGLDARERRGEALFQANCAFCHGADGSGRNWIGRFLEPPARDLTQYTARSLPAARLRRTIHDGLPGTSMPAWRAVLAPGEIEAIAAYVSRVIFRPDAPAASTTRTDPPPAAGR